MRYRCRVEYRLYQRRFRQPLQTAHGLWSDRQGILLRLTDSWGRVGFGEIAPLEWFHSESLKQAWQFCHQLPTEVSPDLIFSIASHLPACRFGLEAAWEQMTAPTVEVPTHCLLQYSHLLPTGTTALQAWQSLWQQGYRTFKWKISVAPLHQELEWFNALMQDLPTTAQLRLDANGGLDWAAACQWLEACGDRPQVEFLEQPLSPDQFDGMLRLSDCYPTRLALDESVATVDQLEHCYQKGWRGVVVIKAAIAGSPSRLRQFCQQPGVDGVWSSVFETAIAQRFITTRLIPSTPQQQRAIGFGVNHWFADSLNQLDAEHLWNSL